jgi:hypothetical protein
MAIKERLERLVGARADMLYQALIGSRAQQRGGKASDHTGIGAHNLRSITHAALPAKAPATGSAPTLTSRRSTATIPLVTLRSANRGQPTSRAGTIPSSGRPMTWNATGSLLVDGCASTLPP